VQEVLQDVIVSSVKRTPTVARASSSLLFWRESLISESPAGASPLAGRGRVGAAAA
jgi:hypothetical protein